VISPGRGFERGFRRHRFERGRADAFRRDLPGPEVDRLTASSPAALTLTILRRTLTSLGGV